VPYPSNSPEYGDGLPKICRSPLVLPFNSQAKFLQKRAWAAHAMSEKHFFLDGGVEVCYKVGYWSRGSVPSGSVEIAPSALDFHS
jgi:hypothetical protein